MVSISSTNFWNFLVAIGFKTIYPKYSSLASEIGLVFSSGFQRISDYQVTGNRFVLICKKYHLKKIGTENGQSIPFEKFIRQYLPEARLSRFLVYLNYQIHDFQATKYLEKYFGIPISTIIYYADQYFLNLFSALPGFVTDNTAIADIAKKIFDNHLVMQLAKTMYIVDLAMKLDAPWLMMQCLGYELRYDPGPILTKEIYNIIKADGDIDAALDNSKSGLRKVIKEYTEIEGEPEMGIGKQCIRQLYEKYTVIHRALINKQASEIKWQIAHCPDLQVMIGHTCAINRTITDSSVAALVKMDNLYLADLLAASADGRSAGRKEKLSVQTMKLPKNRIVIEI